MNDEPSLLPWRLEGKCIYTADGDFIGEMEHTDDARIVVDAMNYYKPDLHCDWRELTPEDAVAHCREVAARLGDTPCARDHLQLAEWIEERDRLRDIVRKTLRAIDALYTAAAPNTIVKELTPDRTCLGVPIGKIVAEARAALGEETK